MTTQRHDPNSLADELDRVLTAGQAAPRTHFDDPLIEAAARLSSAPRPTLAPEVSARIRAAMLTAQAAPRVASGGVIQRFMHQSVFTRLSAAVALLALLVAGTVFAAQITKQFFNPATVTLPPPTVTLTETPSITGSPTNVVPTSMPTLVMPSLAFVAPTDIPQPTPTALPTTALPTAVPQTVTPEPTPQVTIIIEGPVQAINDNVVVIFGFTVVLSPTDPVLSVIQVGDVLHVEGSAGDNNIAIIAAVRAAVVDVEVNVNPSDGQVWRDPGNCSNPPPSWAPAHGWRRRCEGGSSPGNAGGQGMGMGD